jgi:hypothetical protein
MAMLSHPGMTGGIFTFEIKPSTAPVLAFNFQSHIGLNWSECVSHGVRNIAQNLSVIHFAMCTNNSVALVVLSYVKPFATTFAAIVVNIINAASPPGVLHL